MFLVLLQHSLDDLPVALFENVDDATNFAKLLDPFPSEEIADLFHLDATTPTAISVVEFQSPKPMESGHGKLVPVAREVVRDLDAEAATDSP